MRRRAVEEEVVLLDVLPVVSLGAGQAEEPFLEDGVGLVPERKGEAQQPVIVTDPQQPVFSPTVCPRACVIVRKRIPGRAVRRVVLANRPPLALRQVRPPTIPWGPAFARLEQARTLGIGLSSPGPTRERRRVRRFSRRLVTRFPGRLPRHALCLRARDR